MEQNLVQLVLGSAMNIMTFVLVAAGVMKLFQAAADIRDMRQLVQSKLKGQAAEGHPEFDEQLSLDSLQNLAQAVGLRGNAITPEVIPPHAHAMADFDEPVAVPVGRSSKPTISVSKNLVW